MTVSSLTLQSFRSYKKHTFTLLPNTTVIVGENGAGKTNILEAIMLLATGRSFRADRDVEMLSWGATMCRISGIISGDTKLEIQLTDGNLEGHAIPKKRLLVNSVPRRLVDFIGNCRAVLFWPEDLELITDSPSIRRKYLDTVLVQSDREYRRNLLSYERGVRQRNRLLDQINEGKATRNQLLFWNQLLIKSGGYITDKRAEFIEYLNAFHLPESADPADQYQIIYDKSVMSESRLDQYKDAEVAAKVTLVGPHRDDFLVQKLPEKGSSKATFVDLSKYGSRGEQRLAVLWLKLGELSYIESAVGERPLLLLDDILSELDAKHRDMVLALTSRQQTIMTSADPAVLEEVKGEKFTVIQV